MENLKNLIEEKLKKNFPLHQLIHVSAELGNCGAGITIYLVSSEFEGMALLKRHQAIQKNIEEFGEEIHKVVLKPMTPKQFQKKKDKGLIPFN